VRFVNSALKIQCHTVKNALLQTAFSAILPTCIYDLYFILETMKSNNRLVFSETDQSTMPSQYHRLYTGCPEKPERFELLKNIMLIYATVNTKKYA